jgi:hypothetical protein
MTSFVAERSSGIDGVGDPLVAIGIARSRPVGTIALQECDRAPVAPFGATALVSLCEGASAVAERVTGVRVGNAESRATWRWWPALPHVGGIHWTAGGYRGATEAGFAN